VVLGVVVVVFVMGGEQQLVQLRVFWSAHAVI
jgi:hypothetical protein